MILNCRACVPVHVSLRSYNDHGQEGKAHEDTLHLDEQHGARQVGQHSGVEARDQSTDFSSWYNEKGELEQR